MSTIGFFGIDNPAPHAQKDRSYLKVLQELVGPGHSIKLAISMDGVDFFGAFAAKCKAADLDSVICTDGDLLNLVMRALPDFKPSFNKNGAERKLTLDDYNGSLITLPGAKIGRERDLDILFLNPLEHTRTVSYGKFIAKRFISKLTKPESWFPQTDFTWELATPETVESLYAAFTSARLIACDIETDEGSPHRTINCSGYCALFPDGATHAVVIPTIDWWGVSWMRKFNELPAAKIFQNGLYDNLYYLRYNSPCTNWLWDTQHLFHSWYSELPKRLDFITAFSLRKVRFWKDDGKSGGLHAHYEYNARDVWATLNSCLALVDEMPDWARKNYLQEFPMVFPCLHCEADGLRIDKDAFTASKMKVEETLAPLEKQLQVWIPGYNPGSSDQTKRLLKVLGCADKDGNVKSSDEAALKAAASLHPLNERIISHILDIRGYRKLLSTYFVYDKFWNDRLYYKLNPAGTDTGRLASSESSFWCGLQIQNIPARDGPVIKCFITADDGWEIGEGDYAQSEARCVGYLSGCTSLIDLVEGPHDYHAWNASAFFGVSYESIYDESKKKTLNKA
ncbi:MAG TPA: DNA polymerase, partial [Allocoleopsis sp.]